MASYNSYKKIVSEQIPDNIVDTNNLQLGAGNQFDTLLVYNSRGMRCHQCANNSGCVCQACGKCCRWTVPNNVSKATFEIWSGGGGGPGMTCCNQCSSAIGGAGGNYAIRTIDVAPGNSYTICAGGSWRCSKSHTCSAEMGCKSFVSGPGLSSFCTNGGCGGWMCNGQVGGARQHGTCANCGICGIFGADFGITGGMGYKRGMSSCQCIDGELQWAGAGAGIGKLSVNIASQHWCSCGCYVNWPSGGGAPGISSYCDNGAKCCGGGVGQGGSGIVRVTYV